MFNITNLNPSAIVFCLCFVKIIKIIDLNLKKNQINEKIMTWLKWNKEQNKEQNPINKEQNKEQNPTLSKST